MGNVSATSAPPPPPPPTSAPTLPQLEKTDLTTTNDSTTEHLENPGTIEDLHKRCKGIF